ncbi:hypothetical protein [Gordonia sp. NPDC058843]|uniref:hypothetical protein n=1 Tax=Gordonia sp. NPDC058843 TaxID=3346648 RepID=UPI0036B443A0
MINHVCELARQVLLAFFDTYAKSTVVYVDLPDSTRGKTLDSYFFLDSVDVRNTNELYADLGFTWQFSIHPTAAILTDDLSTLTIEGNNLRFRSSSMDRSYAQGFVRFSVVAGAPVVRRLRDEGGAGLRDLHPRLADLALPRLDPSSE